MIEVAVSQLTSPRWDLAEELEAAAALGFEAISLWRSKVSDGGAAAAAAAVAAAGLRVSSLRWAGGFTGGDGRSFVESVEDAVEAVCEAATLGAPVLVVHAGCRGGHTWAHAVRLLVEALDELAPQAHAAGVSLALKPSLPGEWGGSRFLDPVAAAVDVVDRVRHSAVRLAVDLWQFGDAAEFGRMLPRLADLASVVQVADRCGPAAAGADRLPAGRGRLPLERLVGDLVDLGYRGPLEFDPVGEEVENLGHERVWCETRLVTDAWGDRLAAGRPRRAAAGRDGVRRVSGPGYRTADGSDRRSHASSHSGSPG